MTTISRRGAIGIGAGAIAAAGVARAEGREDDPIVVVSTWDFGKAANAAALAKLDAGGTALDAVEAGARVPEADPENHSVGYGGYPHRAGPVTPDALIIDADGRVGQVAAPDDVVEPLSVSRGRVGRTARP